VNQRLLAEIWRYPGRSTRAVIDLDAIVANVSTIRAMVGPDVLLMAVVKANAYGHGAIAVGQTAVDAGADYLGVATVDEGVQLRAAGIKAPIQALGPVDESEIDLAIGRAIELSIGDLDFAKAVAAAAEQDGVTSPVHLHLKVDTGMHRFGAESERVLTIARFIDAQPLLKLRGVFSHFAQADEIDEAPTVEQQGLFDNVLAELHAAGISPEIAHIANSAGALRSRSHDESMVRIGIGLYGLAPSAAVPIADGMRPALTLVSRVRRVFALNPGDGVSYGASYRPCSPEMAALVPIGYGDGYRRAFSSKGWMSIGGTVCPVRGRVCMDQTIVGIPSGITIENGDTVIVGGAAESESVPSFEAMAEQAGTINYEIATGIARRVPRFFIKSGVVVGIEDLHGYRLIRTGGHNNA
jgi:alanine racemase